MNKITELAMGIFSRKSGSPSSAIAPLKPVTGWKQHPIEENGEPLVPLGSFSDYPQIFTDAVYFGERRSSSPYELGELQGALLTSFVREGVAKRLADAAALLPEGYALMAEDCYRTYEVQESLFEYQVGKLMREESKTREVAEEEAQRFVSKPSIIPSRPSPHNTGGAVDLTLIKFSPDAWRRVKHLDKDMAELKRQARSSSSKMKEEGPNERAQYRVEMQRQQIFREESEALPMGTMFDEVSNATPMRYFETLAEKRQLDPYEQHCLENRRLLNDVMQRAGFLAYDEEPWHFDFGNQFHAIKTGAPAIYGPAVLSKQNMEHETMRQQHLIGNLREHDDPRIHWQARHPDSSLRQFVREVALATGNPAHSTHPLAHKL